MVSGLVLGVLLSLYRWHELVVECLLLVLDLCLALVSYAFNPFLVRSELSQIALFLVLPIRILSSICQASNIVCELSDALLDFLLRYLADVIIVDIFHGVHWVWNC